MQLPKADGPQVEGSRLVLRVLSLGRRRLSRWASRHRDSVSLRLIRVGSCAAHPVALA